MHCDVCVHIANLLNLIEFFGVLGVVCCSVSRVFVLVFPFLVGLLAVSSGLSCFAKDVQSPEVDKDELSSLQPPPDSAAAKAAMADIVTGPSATAGPDPQVAAERCPSHAAEVLRPPVLLSLLIPCMFFDSSITQAQYTMPSVKQKGPVGSALHIHVAHGPEQQTCMAVQQGS